MKQLEIIIGTDGERLNPRSTYVVEDMLTAVYEAPNDDAIRAGKT